jgi:hypothetical protein
VRKLFFFIKEKYMFSWLFEGDLEDVLGALAMICYPLAMVAIVIALNS